MTRIGFGYSKTSPIKGYVKALKCDNRFYVVTKRQYSYMQRQLRTKRPVFHADLPVYIDGINI